MTLDRRRLLGAAGVAMTVGIPAGCAAGSADEVADAAARLRVALAAQPDLPEFLRYATLAPNGHNTQPWRFAARASGVSILPDVTRRTPVVDPDDHHLFVSLGCATENLVLAAGTQGRACAVAIDPTDGHIDVDFAAARPTSGAARALAEAIPLRQSTRSAYDGRGVSVEVLRELEAAARTDGVSVRLVVAPAERDRVLEAVVAGNSAQMDDPAFVAELLSWIRFSPERALATADGLYSACTGNPTLPDGLGRRLFPLVFRKAAENDKYAAQLRSSAGIAVFVGERADPVHWVRVGRAFERFALRATALGLRHAHVNQPVEVPALRSDFARVLGLGEARPDLVVRFGAGPTLPMSMRRSVVVTAEPAQRYPE